VYPRQRRPIASSNSSALGQELTFCTLRHVSKEGICPCWIVINVGGPHRALHGAWHRLHGGARLTSNSRRSNWRWLALASTDRPKLLVCRTDITHSYY
jgi:hypothetical protein